jgi:hypothetical protein
MQVAGQAFTIHLPAKVGSRVVWLGITATEGTAWRRDLYMVSL